MIHLVLALFMLLCAAPAFADIKTTASSKDGTITYITKFKANDADTASDFITTCPYMSVYYEQGGGARVSVYTVASDNTDPSDGTLIQAYTASSALRTFFEPGTAAIRFEADVLETGATSKAVVTCTSRREGIGHLEVNRALLHNYSGPVTLTTEQADGVFYFVQASGGHRIILPEIFPSAETVSSVRYVCFLGTKDTRWSVEPHANNFIHFMDSNGSDAPGYALLDHTGTLSAIQTRGTSLTGGHNAVLCLTSGGVNVSAWRVTRGSTFGRFEWVAGNAATTHPQGHMESCTVNIESAAAADDIMCGRPLVDLTLFSFDCTGTGGSPSSHIMQVVEYDSTGDNAAAATATVTITNTTANFQDRTFVDATIDADNYWGIETLSGTAATWTACTVNYTRMY